VNSSVAVYKYVMFMCVLVSWIVDC